MPHTRTPSVATSVRCPRLLELGSAVLPVPLCGRGRNPMALGRWLCETGEVYQNSTETFAQLTFIAPPPPRILSPSTESSATARQ